MTDDTYLTIHMNPYYIRVFRNALKAVGMPRYVRFLMEPDSERMAMTAYDRKEFTSFRVPQKISESGNKNACVRIHSHILCKALFRQFGWDTLRTYRIPGKLYPEQKAVIYNLTEAFSLDRP